MEAIKKRLRDTYFARRSQDPTYDIERYSRDLGIARGRLQELLTGKREFSRRLVQQISIRLKFTERESVELLSYLEDDEEDTHVEIVVSK